MARNTQVAADPNAPPITQLLARFVATHPSRGWSDAVDHEAHRTFMNWVGCAVGAARHEAAESALAAVRMLQPAAQATVLGRRDRIDMAGAALVNGITSHTFDYDDTHLKTIIHPAGPVASALLALAEHTGASGRQLIDALVLGIDVSCRIGNVMYPDHYDRGWHITGSTGTLGAAAGCARLLGLDEAQTAMALGIAASQPVGMREQFGTMTKPFHPGAAARAGLMSALLAKNGFTASAKALEAPRGMIQTVSTKCDWREATDELGRRFEISFNSYKPFACGIVIHPSIDACVQLREQGVRPEQVQRIELKVHSLVLELTGKKTPADGLQAKFSVYHGCAAGLTFGRAGRGRVFRRGRQSTGHGGAARQGRRHRGRFDRRGQRRRHRRAERRPAHPRVCRACHRLAAKADERRPAGRQVPRLVGPGAGRRGDHPPDRGVLASGKRRRCAGTRRPGRPGLRHAAAATAMTAATQEAIRPDTDPGPGVDFDVIIVGAGLSGVASAYYLQTECPGRSYAILESRQALGGTWDLFRYPGIRCDSDMFTLGYSFRPWDSDRLITEGPAIRDYVADTAREHGIDSHIRYGHRVVEARWRSDRACWELTVAVAGASGEQRLRCRFLSFCSGYYDYEQGFDVQWPGRGDFKGRIVHPQHWPADLDCTGRKVVIIGSGATAVTLLPELAKQASHVTMLQRSPSYVLALPARDAVGAALRRWLPRGMAHGLIRWKNILLARWLYRVSRRNPRLCGASWRRTRGNCWDRISTSKST